MSDATEEVVLRYVTTRADVIAKLQRYASQSSAARYFPPASYFAIVGLAWLSAWLFYVRQGDRNLVYVASAALALVLTVALPWLYRRYQDSFFASVLTDDRLRGLAGPVELVVGEGGVEERSGVSIVHAKWSDVIAVEPQPGRIFIFVAPLVAILVPDHAFASGTERDAFLNLVRARSGSSSD